MQFYRNSLPQYEDYVMVRISSHDEKLGIYCQLVEYSDYPALLMNSEISKYKVNYNKNFPIGKIIPCMIYTIDGSDVNLTYKRITDETKLELENKYIERLQLYKLFSDIYHNFKNIITQKYANNMFWNCMDYIEENNLKVRHYYETILEDLALLFNFDSEKLLIENTEYLNNLTSRIKTTDILYELQIKLTILESGFLELINRLFCNTSKIKITCVSSPVYSLILESSDSNLENIKLIYSNFIKELENKLTGFNHILEKNLFEIKIIKNKTYSVAYPKYN